MLVKSCGQISFRQITASTFVGSDHPQPGNLHETIQRVKRSLHKLNFRSFQTG